MTTRGARSWLAALAVTALACGGAQAADLPATAYKAPAYAAAPFSWTGFYAGANLGGAFTGNDGFANAASGNGGKLSGVIGGLQAGYNYQLSPLVVVGRPPAAPAPASRCSTSGCFCTALRASRPAS